jgi:hypothetical protein
VHGTREAPAFLARRRRRAVRLCSPSPAYDGIYGVGPITASPPARERK